MSNPKQTRDAQSSLLRENECVCLCVCVWGSEHVCPSRQCQHSSSHSVLTLSGLHIPQRNIKYIYSCWNQSGVVAISLVFIRQRSLHNTNFSWGGFVDRLKCIWGLVMDEDLNTVHHIFNKGVINLKTTGSLQTCVFIFTLTVALARKCALKSNFPWKCSSISYHGRNTI